MCVTYPPKGTFRSCLPAYPTRGTYIYICLNTGWLLRAADSRRGRRLHHLHYNTTIRPTRMRFDYFFLLPASALLLVRAQHTTRFLQIGMYKRGRNEYYNNQSDVLINIGRGGGTHAAMMAGSVRNYCCCEYYLFIGYRHNIHIILLLL